LEASVISEPANERPVVSTFAAQLPFPLRLESGSVFTYELARTYADPRRAAAVFPGSPWVRIRIYNQPLTQAPRIRPALQELYQTEVDIDDWQPDGAYVQWVSLETPTLLLSDEPPEDGAFAFHRCLHGLNLFLNAHNVAFADSGVYLISTQGLDPAVIVGHYEADGDWQFDSPMLVHPERLADYRPLQTRAGETVEHALAAGIGRLMSGHPMMTTFAFTMRADRAGRIEGDALNQVVSLQTAMENRLFTIWRLILVDQGKSSSEIEQAVEDQRFAPLVRARLPQLLGGPWDTTAPHTTVGTYWSALYQLRNRVVHAGYMPMPREAEAALEASRRMRQFARDRIWEWRRQYPRTALTGSF
jgi:hypothetical protein